MPTGTFPQNTARQSHAASSPPGGQPDELPGEPRDLVHSQGEAAPLPREGVGQDRGRVRREHRGAERLREARMIDPSRLDMHTAIVVFASATRRYRSPRMSGASLSAAVCSVDCSSLLRLATCLATWGTAQ
ncbi:MAG: hypothetical protein ACRDP6_05215 [Actinoallomurus sp.]